MITVIIDGKQHSVRGRVAEIIMWLVRSAERINTGTVGVKFAYRGQTLKVVTEHEETIN